MREHDIADNSLGSINVVERKTRKRTKAKIRFIEFLRPDCYWPSPYNLEQALHVFQWMVRTGAEYRQYPQSGVWELLSFQPTCIGFFNVKPITGIADLKKRFHYALLSRYASTAAEEWRKDYGINTGGERLIYFSHYRPYGGGVLLGESTSEYNIEKRFESFLNTTGRLKVSLNECHKKARQIKGIDLAVDEDGFKFILHFGYNESGGWEYQLARTRKGESFLDTFSRAIKELNALR